MSDEASKRYPPVLSQDLDAILSKVTEANRHGEIGLECDHTEYDFGKHGRRCLCGKLMADWGD
ncbi:hypothetical protein [Mesorhizobium wenxiniae]|uniref:Uncharacterized protein n=1 Tax=Mesorhizobium wenxiniae TaxID=2014805 RepID=A0A271KDV8_9HYPH|nr:hypothetical protein [Mesorhizobium wenxiniae]PAP93972.1 hypothetical protein CIT31_16530 [Mesorhizobium wenxiniae]